MSQGIGRTGMNRSFHQGSALTLAAAAFLLLPPRALACQCKRRPPVCQAFFANSEIFSGTVVSRTPVTAASRGKSYVSGYQYKFSVDRTYRGATSGTALVGTGSGGGDCGYIFHEGRRYIVFANGSNGRIGTSICGLTAPWTSALDEEIRKQAASKQRTASFFGIAYIRAGKIAPAAPTSSMTVVIDPDNDPRQAVSDSQGRFKITDIPPGKHKVKVIAPAGYSIGWPQTSSPKHELIEDIELQPAGCLDRDYIALVGGSVSGRFVDAHGNVPPPEAIPSEVELVSADPTDQKTFFSDNVNKQDGTFTIEGVPEGRYLLAHNVVTGESLQNPFLPTYYPGRHSREEATTLEVHHGARVAGLTMQPGKEQPRVRVDVRVLSERGEGLANANVWNTSVDPSYLRSSATISFSKTDSTGLAHLTSFKGRQEEIKAYWDCTDKRTQLHGKTTHSSTHDGEAIRIVLAGSCRE